MNIQLNGTVPTEPTTTTFKSVKPGIHTLTISQLEGAKAGTKDVLKVTFDSTEAEASFSHNFFLTEKAIPSFQYLVNKFTGAPLEGDFSVEALAAVLVGKSKVCVVDGQIVPKNKDDKWYNNTFPRLRFAGFVEPEGDDATPRINREQEMDLSAVNDQAGDSTSTSSTVKDDDSLPF